MYQYNLGKLFSTSLMLISTGLLMWGDHTNALQLSIDACFVWMVADD